jgi:hypothetical protein
MVVNKTINEVHQLKENKSEISIYRRIVVSNQGRLSPLVQWCKHSHPRKNLTTFFLLKNSPMNLHIFAKIFSLSGKFLSPYFKGRICAIKIKG